MRMIPEPELFFRWMVRTTKMWTQEYDRLLAEGWEPFGFAIAQDGSDVVAFRMRRGE